MKASEIEVGGYYMAKVSNRVVKVKVDGVREVSAYRGVNYYTGGGGRRCEKTVYDVTNTETGRKTTFRSAAKFRSRVIPQVVVGCSYCSTTYKVDKDLAEKGLKCENCDNPSNLSVVSAVS